MNLKKYARPILEEFHACPPPGGSAGEPSASAETNYTADHVCPTQPKSDHIYMNKYMNMYIYMNGEINYFFASKLRF
jgi:hypothetical protein